MSTPWETFIDQKMAVLSKTKVVVDIGGSEPFQKDLAKYKSQFSKTKFYTVDFNHHFGPTVTGDVHQLPFANESVDGLICKAVLEHVYQPFTVVEEMTRIAKPKAKLFLYVPFLYPYHGNNDYKDYFRYTHDGLRELFKNWSQVELQYVRGYAESLLYMLPRPLSIVSPLGRIVDGLISNHQQVSGYQLWAIK